MKYALSIVLRFFSAAAPREPLQCLRALGCLAIAVATAALLLSFGIHINLSASAPRGLYQAVAGPPTPGVWVAVCVKPEAAAVGLARGYLRAGPCPGGAEPILKPVVAIAGDVVDVGPQAVIVNGMSLAGSESAPVDSSGRPLPHAPWGRHVLATNELWLMSTQVPNSWDSRYLGPFGASQLRAVARPMWTIDATAPGKESAGLSR